MPCLIYLHSARKGNGRICPWKGKKFSRLLHLTLAVNQKSCHWRNSGKQAESTKAQKISRYLYARQIRF